MAALTGSYGRSFGVAGLVAPADRFYGGCVAPGTLGQLVDDKTTGWWLIVGSGLAALGSFLPWISFRTQDWTTFTRSGLEDAAGAITLVCGTVIGIIGGYIVGGSQIRRGILMVLWMALITAGAVWFTDFLDIRDRIATIHWGPTHAKSVGSGIWAIAVGLSVALVGLVQMSAAVLRPNDVDN